MILQTYRVQGEFHRSSKLGKPVVYKRMKTILIIECDNCGNKFERNKSQMSPQRQTNLHFHVCTACDAKRFAQQRSAEKRGIWNRLADSTAVINRFN